MIIKLHTNGKPVYLNVDNIVIFYSVSSGTVVGTTADGTYKIVDETPEIIAEMINGETNAK